jgi:hypothetical protein
VVVVVVEEGEVDDGSDAVVLEEKEGGARCGCAA